MPGRGTDDQGIEGSDARAIKVADVDGLEAGLGADVAGDHLSVACVNAMNRDRHCCQEQGPRREGTSGQPTTAIARELASICIPVVVE